MCTIHDKKIELAGLKEKVLSKLAIKNCFRSFRVTLEAHLTVPYLIKLDYPNTNCVELYPGGLDVQKKVRFLIKQKQNFKNSFWISSMTTIFKPDVLET